MDMQTGGGLGPSGRESRSGSGATCDRDLGARADTLEFERSAHRHDQEARLYDQLAAETCGPLHLGFLHAAEAHRVAARQDRAMGAAHLLPSSSRDVSRTV